MLNWCLAFLSIAIVSAILGFSGMTGGAALIAKIVFSVFLMLFVISAIANMVQNRST